MCYVYLHIHTFIRSSMHCQYVSLDYYRLTVDCLYFKYICKYIFFDINYLYEVVKYEELERMLFYFQHIALSNIIRVHCAQLYITGKVISLNLFSFFFNVSRNFIHLSRLSHKPALVPFFLPSFSVRL